MGRNILGIFDGADIEEISALVDKLEKSSFDYMSLEGNGISIVIGKNGAGEVTKGITATSAHAAEVSAAPVQAKPAETPSIASPEIVATSEKAIVAEKEGIVIVRSPNYGLFYAQSAPGAPPYVTIGDTVKAGDTVGLLETMKTFTGIPTPVAGKVIAIHVINEETLEPNQPILSVEVS